MKQAAHRLVKEAHEDAVRELMEKKELLNPFVSVKTESEMNLVCDCQCGTGSIATVAPTSSGNCSKLVMMLKVPPQLGQTPREIAVSDDNGSIATVATTSLGNCSK